MDRHTHFELILKISSPRLILAHCAGISLILFTSMFGERMEVLEYRRKFEVELSTFPDSTNTETPRKVVFSLTCVCAYVCLCVCLSV